MLNDLRFALRMLRKNPGFAAVAVCSLAIGIGANSAVYSFANTLMLRPLPVPQASRVVSLSALNGQQALWTDTNLFYPDYLYFRDHNRSFAGVVASSDSTFGFTADKTAQPRISYGMFVSGNFFSVLRAPIGLGRGFRAEEDKVVGRDRVVVLSHDLWVSDFHARTDVVGKKLWLNGVEMTVVGVTRPEFRVWEVLRPALFVPIAMAPTLGTTNTLEQRDARWLTVRGRLLPGLGTAQAQADLDILTQQLSHQFPSTDASLRVKVQSEMELRAKQSPPNTMLLVMLGGLSLCVLAVACANVASLLLSRSTVRAREIAVRLAIGASRGSLVRQLLLENLLLSLAGGAAGLLIASAAISFFNTLPAPTEVPLNLTFSLDNQVLLFTLLIAVASTFFFGLTPAFRTTQVELTTSLKDKDGLGGSPHRLWGRKMIVVGQVAVCLVLLSVSGALFQGIRTQLTQGAGFRTDRLQLMSFDPSLMHYSPERQKGFYRDLLQKVRLLPALRSAALSSSVPMSMNAINTTGIVPEGYRLQKGETSIDCFSSVITPGYFETVGIPIARGRGFTDQDRDQSKLVVVVNEQLARHYWPNQNPIGKTLRLADASRPPLEVVGVARNSKYLWISEMPTDFVYLPLTQNPQANMTLMAESVGPDVAEILPALREAVRSIDRNMPMFEVRTMKSLYEGRAVGTSNMIIETVSAMGLMGLVLAVVGLYGVVAYSVSTRSREFGIRMAIGAARGEVIRMVLRQGLFLGGSGLVVGAALSTIVLRALLSSVLFSLHVGVWPFAAAAFLLLGTILLAAYGPARRASLIDPMRALREE